MIILDTNVVSEPMQPRPSETVMRWLAQHSAELFVTSVSQAEMHYGFAILPHGKKRTALTDAARQVFRVDFADRVLPFDGAAAEEFAMIAAERKRSGRAMKILDAQIAAIARARGAAVATRDVGDFEHSGVEIINPWLPNAE